MSFWKGFMTTLGVLCAIWIFNNIGLIFNFLNLAFIEGIKLIKFCIEICFKYPLATIMVIGLIYIYYIFKNVDEEFSQLDLPYQECKKKRSKK